MRMLTGIHSPQKDLVKDLQEFVRTELNLIGLKVSEGL